MVAEILQALPIIGEKVWGIAIGVFPALIVYAVTQKQVRDQKDIEVTAREEAKKEFTSAITPALALFKNDLLATMNGTYLRTKEATIHFDNIHDALKRIEAKT